MKNKLIKIFSITLMLLGLLIPAISLAQVSASGTEPIIEPPLLEFSIPGRMEGTGTYFEIKDNQYLNVSLKSTEEINIILESIPRMISLNIESSSSAPFTELTIEGLASSTTYYQYEDSYKNEAVFISDEKGIYTWTQNLTQPHHIWIQEIRGTIFIPD
ncbi:MAG: hypothetical protein ACE5J0_02310, partial [Candidatus Paceibacterales bacterium]